ncbi:unnamed protein product, partial [Notodromas monacha]
MLGPRFHRGAFTALIFLNNFLHGLEYSLILPSMWKYMQSQGLTSKLYFGAVVASFHFAATVSGVIAGCCTKRSSHVKRIVATMSLFQVAGNTLYFMGGSPGILLTARFIAGLGAGSMTGLYSELNRSTVSRERSSLLTGVFLAYHLSIVAGPGLNALIYSRMHGFALGSLRVEGENAAGLLLAAAWALYFLLFVFFFSSDFQGTQTPNGSEGGGSSTPPSSRYRYRRLATAPAIDASGRKKIGRKVSRGNFTERSSLALQRHVPYGAATNLDVPWGCSPGTISSASSRLTASAPELNLEEGEEEDDEYDSANGASSTTPSTWSSSRDSIDDISALAVRSCDVVVMKQNFDSKHSSSRRDRHFVFPAKPIMAASGNAFAERLTSSLVMVDSDFGGGVRSQPLWLETSLRYCNPQNKDFKDPLEPRIKLLKSRCEKPQNPEINDYHQHHHHHQPEIITRPTCTETVCDEVVLSLMLLQLATMFIDTMIEV